MARGTTGTARVTLARVLAVLAIVLGIGLMQGAICDAVGTSTACCETATAPGAVTSADQSAASGDSGAVSGGDRGGSTVEACLMVFLAVLFALVGLVKPGLLRVRPLGRVVVRRKHRTRPRTPLLTQLCVSRT